MIVSSQGHCEKSVMMKSLELNLFFRNPLKITSQLHLASKQETNLKVSRITGYVFLFTLFKKIKHFFVSTRENTLCHSNWSKTNTDIIRQLCV